MKEFLDSARSVVETRYALLTPAGLAPSALPGWEKAACQVAISPALGARFCQLLVTLQTDGLCEGNTGRNELVVYVLEGAASVQSDNRRQRLDAGSCSYVPPGKDIQIRSGSLTARLVVFQKPYQPQHGVSSPAPAVTQERDVKPHALAGAPGVTIQPLLSADRAFDMAINLVTFQPGAALPAVATEVMEHGILVIRGQGVFRLGTQWLPAQAGDVVWTASYCPLWFAAIGAAPASYLCYQDVNRDPM